MGWVKGNCEIEHTNSKVFGELISTTDVIRVPEAARAAELLDAKTPRQEVLKIAPTEVSIPARAGPHRPATTPSLQSGPSQTR